MTAPLNQFPVTEVSGYKHGGCVPFVAPLQVLLHPLPFPGEVIFPILI